MKTKTLVLGVLGLGCVAVFSTAVSVAGGGADKVELCHIPPGDPSDAHTITVGLKAAESHLANHEGDHLGACPPTCGDGNSCDDGDLCTVDICLDTGFCDNSSPVDCDAGNLCTEDFCDSVTGCANEPNTDPCDDGYDCTTGDTCVGGACIGPDPCGDGEVCGDEECDDGNQTDGDGCSSTCAIECPCFGIAKATDQRLTEKTVFTELGHFIGTPAYETRKVLFSIVRLYEAWHTAEPGNGYDAKAAQWRAKLPKDEANEDR